jgi:hypothetical protein
MKKTISHTVGGRLIIQKTRGLRELRDRRIVREDGRVHVVVIIHDSSCRLIGRGVVDEVGDVGAHLGIQDEVDELMRVLRMRCAFGDAQAVLPYEASLLGHDVGDVVVLVHHLQDVAVPFHGQVDLAGEQQVLAVVFGEGLDVRLLLDQHLLDLLDLRGIDGVVGIAAIHQSRPDDAFAEQRDAPGILVRLHDDFPAIRGTGNLRLPIADTLGAPHIGHRELAARIELGVLEGRIDVAEVGDLGKVDLLQHVGDDHAFHVVVGRHDQVVAGIALFQLGEELVVIGEEIHLDLDAACILEVVERRLADIGVPVVEVDLRLFGAPTAPGYEGEAGRHGAGSRQEAAA